MKLVNDLTIYFDTFIDLCGNSASRALVFSNKCAYELKKVKKK